MLQVDVAQIVVHEGDEANAVLDFLEGHELAGEDGGDIDFFAVDSDAAAGGDHLLPVVQRIAEFWQASIGAG